MAGIYENAYVTLRAISASRCLVGYFYGIMTRNTEKSIQLTMHDGRPVAIAVRHKLLRWNDMASMATTQGRYPLLSRG